VQGGKGKERGEGAKKGERRGGEENGGERKRREWTTCVSSNCP